MKHELRNGPGGIPWRALEIATSNSKSSCEKTATNYTNYTDYHSL